MGFSDSQLCLQFSKHVADTILIIKVALGSTGVLASLLVVLLIGVMKLYKQFVYRLVLYLMAINALQALFQILELVPIEVTDNNIVLLRNGTGWEDACSVIGYLDIGVVWMGNLVIVWTMLYMLSLSWQLHRLQQASHRVEAQPADRTVRVGEIVGVLFVIFAPFLFNWIPFVMHMYGPSDFMCWIKTVGKNGCGNSKLQHWSIALMAVLFYGPITAIVTFGLVCFIAIIFLLHRTSKYLHGGIRQRYKSSMKEMGMLLIYPLIYFVPSCLPLESILSCTPSLQLAISITLHSIHSGFCTLLLTQAVLCSQHWLFCCIPTFGRRFSGNQTALVGLKMMLYHRTPSTLCHLKTVISVRASTFSQLVTTTAA